jgi:hypothetical protein
MLKAMRPPTVRSPDRLRIVAPRVPVDGLNSNLLVETLDDAVRTLSKCRIEYLYLPEYNKLITVKN